MFTALAICLESDVLSSKLVINDESIGLELRMLPQRKLNKSENKPSPIKYAICYRDKGGEISTRCISPIAIEHMDDGAVLRSYCFLQADYRRFKLSNIIGQIINIETNQPVQIMVLYDICQIEGLEGNW